MPPPTPSIKIFKKANKQKEVIDSVNAIWEMVKSYSLLIVIGASAYISCAVYLFVVYVFEYLIPMYIHRGIFLLFFQIMNCFLKKELQNFCVNFIWGILLCEDRRYYVVFCKHRVRVTGEDYIIILEFLIS